MNLITCNKSIKNTGLIGCPLEMKNIFGLLYVKKGTIITPTQEASIMTTLSALLKNDNQENRAYPIKTFVGIEEGGEDAVMSTTPYGSKTVGRDGIYGFTFEYREGALSLHRVYASFTDRQSQFDAYFIDKENNGLWGTQTATGKKGFALGLIQEKKVKMNNGTDDMICYHSIELDDAKELDLNPAFIAFPSTTKVLTACTGLYQSELELATPMATGVFELNLFSNTRLLYDDLATIINGSTTLFKAYNNVTGNEITITSIGAGTTIAKSFKFTLNTADPDYTALAVGGLVRIEYGPVSALETALIFGYSEATFYVTKN